MTPNLRQLLEDRLNIKATQILRRRISSRELTTFFIKNTHSAEKVHRDMIKELDKLIVDYLEGIK